MLIVKVCRIQKCVYFLCKICFSSLIWCVNPETNGSLNKISILLLYIKLNFTFCIVVRQWTHWSTRHGAEWKTCCLMIPSFQWDESWIWCICNWSILPWISNEINYFIFLCDRIKCETSSGVFSTIRSLCTYNEISGLGN